MSTLHAERDRHAIAERVRTLDANAPARWGKFTAPRMLAHLSDSLRMATGDLAVAEKKTFLRFPLIKLLIIHVAPFPRSAPTAPELVARPPLSFESEKDDLCRMLERFAARDPRATWPAHPAFGSLSGRDWGALAYKHSNHHLRQFGA